MCAGEGGGLGFSCVVDCGGVEEVMRRWSSLISSRAVSVYRGADLTTLSATWRFILKGRLDLGRDGMGRTLLLVLCEPDGGKVAPSEFANNDIAIVRERVADFDGMIASSDVVLPVLLVLSHYRR